MYKDIIKEITFDELKERCKNGEIDINSPAGKIWVVNYLGGTAEEQADHILNMFVDNEIAFMVEIDPTNLFKVIYSVKDRNDHIDIIAMFNDNIIDFDKLNSVYEETIEEFTIDSYIKQQEQLNSIEKEEYDPLGFKEQQAKIDKIKQQYKDGEISLGEMLQEFGYDEYNKERVIEVAEKLIKKELSFEDLQNMYNNGELTSIDLLDISSIIDKEFPELHEEFNRISK